MLPDITDEKGRIRPEFANLPPEYWVSLISPHTDGEGRVSFDRLGDFTHSGPSIQNRLPDMPAPGANLASSALPPVQHYSHNGLTNLGLLEKVGLIAVTIADDDMPLVLGVLAVIFLVLIFLL